MIEIKPTITPEVGKRYVTRGGWITPPITLNDDDDAKFYPFKAMDTFYTASGLYFDNNTESEFDIISEYVEPTPTAPDTFRRDLIARLYCELVMSTEHQYRSQSVEVLAESAISIADTLIKAMEAQP